MRKAEKKDASVLAEINYLVMKEFFKQTAATKEEEALQIQFLEQCIESENTVFTYKNAIIVEREGEIAGAAWIYDFTKEKRRLESISTVDFVYDTDNLLLQFIEEDKDEARAGDIYLDTIAVAKKWRGKGVASELIGYAKEIIEDSGGKPLTLIVDVENPHAQKVYEKHDFEVVEEQELYHSTFRYMRFN